MKILDIININSQSVIDNNSTLLNYFKNKPKKGKAHKLKKGKHGIGDAPSNASGMPSADGGSL